MLAIRRLALVAGLLSLAAAALPAGAVPGAAGGALASENVEFVATIPDLGAVGAQIRGDLMYVTTTQGLHIYDVSAGIPVLFGALEIPHLQNEDVETNGEILLIASDHFVGAPTVLYVVDVSSPRTPVLTAPPLTVGAAHTATCINGCSYAWLGGGSGRVFVVDLRDPTRPSQVASFPIVGTVHDVQVDAAGIAWVSTSQGLVGYTTADPVRPEPIGAKLISFAGTPVNHNSLRPNATAWRPRTAPLDDTVQPGELVLATQENWITISNQACRQDGVFQTARYTSAAGVARLERLDTFRLGQGPIPPTDRKPRAVVSCSSHYFDHRADGIVAVAWYEQGTRFLDVSDPRDIRQVGYFVPALGETIATRWNGDYLYTFDTYRGIDVLRLTGTAGAREASLPAVAPVRAPRPPDPRFGGVCRIAA